MSKKQVPVYEPALGSRERAYLLEAFDSGWISSRGAFVSRFEQAFGTFVGTPNVTSVCNGTVALHLALAALGIGTGDEVVVPTLTYIASANTIAQTGATPVFADSLSATWQIDPADVERRITARTRAIMAVHLYGQACDLPSLRALADRHRLLLVEDCAEAFGTLIGDRHVGTWGDAAAFSFFGNKTITTGEGGMVVARDPAVLAHMTSLKNQGLSKNREYWHDELGYNYRMTNLCAAIGLAQVERARELIARKRELAATYRRRLERLPLVIHGETPGTTHSFWMVSVLVNDPVQRDPLRRALAADGIETRPLFLPAHEMPMYSSHADGHYPVAQDLSSRGINLPSWPGMGDGEIDQVCAAIERHFDRA